MENRWIGAELDEGDAGYYSAVTDDNGYFEINIGSIGTGMLFEISPDNIDGYVAPSERLEIASGVVNNVDFVFETPTDSVYGFLKDDDGTVVTTVGEVYVEQRWSGEGERWTTTTSGRYVLLGNF